METPQYIKSLLMPNGKQPKGRRVWSIDLETVWLPFFTATNTMGETEIPADALGAPLRLAYEADGSVKFSKTGRPVTKVAKEIGDSVKLVKENFTASLLAYANGVIAENPDGYKAQVEDRQNLEKAIAKLHEQEIAEAIAETQPKGKGKAKAEAEPEAEAEAEAVGVTG